MFQTMYERTLCEHSLYSPMLSICKLTYFKWKTITAGFNVNGGVFLNSKENNPLGQIPIVMMYTNFWSEHLPVPTDSTAFAFLR